MNQVQTITDSPAFLVLLIILVIVHFLPTMVAFSRNHASRWMILIINFLLGWTVIGWAILLYWAAKGEKQGLLG